MNARFQREIFINVMNYRLIILEELLRTCFYIIKCDFHVIGYSL